MLQEMLIHPWVIGRAEEVGRLVTLVGQAYVTQTSGLRVDLP